MDTGPRGSVTALRADDPMRGTRVQTNGAPAAGRRPFVAGAPISWGVCEVPGWGPAPAAEMVLAQMQQLGLTGTELGPEGFLPDAPEAVSAEVGAYGLRLVGGFLPLVLYSGDPERVAAALADTDRAAAKLAAGARPAAAEPANAGSAAGPADASTGPADTPPPPALNVALVEDMDWSTPHELSDAEWAQTAANLLEVRHVCAGHGVVLAVHPHFDTLLERDDQIRRALAEFEGIGWCLDTGHLTIAGTDPAAFARDHGQQVTHVHLKDVDAPMAKRLAAREMTLLDATKMGLFRPLGQGDVDVAGTLAQLRAHEYAGWLVLEQDTSLTGDEPPVSAQGPMRDVQTSIRFMENSAHRGEEKVL